MLDVRTFTRARSALLVVIALLAQGVCAGQGKLEFLGESAMPAPTWVRHPSTPLFRTDADGWPIVSEAGYVALRDEGPGFVYWTAKLPWPKDRKSDHPSRGRENWGQVETFASLARVVRSHREEHPTALPMRIGHISGEYGGFPDLVELGYSSHHSHQTGLHVNLLLVPRDAGADRITVDIEGEGPWNEAATLGLMDACVRMGGRYLATNRGVLHRALADGWEKLAARHPALGSFAGELQGSSEVLKFYPGPNRTQLLVLMAPGNHADHVNVCFSPTR